MSNSVNTTDTRDLSKIDFNNIETLLSTSRQTLGGLTALTTIPSQELRTILKDKYGDRLIFKRGRTGGIFLTPIL